MKIRPATIDDAGVIATLEAAAAHAPWSEEQIRDSLACSTTRAWIAGEPPAGHLLATTVADEGEILILAVHPEARRRGVARALLEACATAWRAAGVLNGWLEVRVDNAGARALYRGAGWIEAGLRPCYYDDRADAAVLKWEAP